MKNFKELKTIEELQRVFPEGSKVRCKIKDIDIEDAEIHYEQNRMFILQDLMEGAFSKIRRGYKYSWLTFDRFGLKYSGVEDLEKACLPSSKQKLKQMTYKVKEEKEVIKLIPEPKYKLGKEYLYHRTDENYVTEMLLFNHAVFSEEKSEWVYKTHSQKVIFESELDKYLIK